MNKLFTKVAALTLGVAMAAGVGVALGSAKASEAKADYVLAYSFDFETASTGTSSELNATSAVTFLNTAAGSSVVASASNVAKAYSAKGSGGSGVPDKVLKLGSGSAAGSLTFTLASTADEVTKAVLTAYNWPKKAVDITVNSVQRTKASATAASVDDYVFEFAATREIAMSVPADRAFSITKIELYKTSGTPVTSYSVTDSVEHGSVSPSTVSEGTTLTATITPDTGYNVPETVSVTMGGTAATHTYQNGVVTVQNVTGDVEITGSCVEIPVTPEPAVVETTFADFIAATDADYAKAYHFSATIKAFKSGDTKDKYGNMTLTDGTTDLTVYGSTADATKLVWNGVSAKYEFTNPQDFMTTDLTNNSNVGDTVEVKFVRYFHNSKLNAQGIILSVTPGETPEIPEPEMVTGKKLSDLFADTAGNGKQLYEVTGVVSKWKDGTATDGTQYGNFYLKESLDSDAEYYIYGATADATKLVWGTASGVYSFTNPKDFLTNEVTKDVVIGSTLTMRLTRCDYNTTLEATGIVVSVVPPAQTEWTEAQKTQLETALHGYLPPFFGELAEDMTTTENSAVFTVSGDLSDQFATKLGDGWNLVSDNNYMKIEDNYYLTASIYTYGVKSLPVGDYSEFTFTYHEGQPPATDWSADQKTAFAAVLDGFVPGYFGAPVAEPTVNVNNVLFDVSGDLTDAAETYFATGWQEDQGYYVQGTQNGVIQASFTVENDVTHFTFQFIENQPVLSDWTDEQKAFFEGALEGVVPPFLGDEFAHGTIDTQYGEYTASATGDFTTQIETACASWIADEGAFLKQTAHGYAVIEYAYKDEATSVDVYFYQTAWFDEQIADFQLHLGGYVPTFNSLVNSMSYRQTQNDYLFAYYGDYVAKWTSYFAANNIVLVDGEQSTYYVKTSLGTVYFQVQTQGSDASLATIVFMWYVADPIPTSLQLDTTDVKVSYYVGDEFDATGLVVKVLDENGDVMYNGQDVAQYCEFEYDFSAVGAAVVTVKLEVSQGQYLTAEINVTVEEAPFVYDADAFAKELLEKVAPICANYDGKKNNRTALKEVWTEMAVKYGTLSEEEKAKVVAAAAKADGTDLEKAMAFYNFACKKYGLTKFIAGRQVKAIVNEPVQNNSILPIVVIVASSVAAVTAIGVVIALKRRKSLLTK